MKPLEQVIDNFLYPSGPANQVQERRGKFKGYLIKFDHNGWSEFELYCHHNLLTTKEGFEPTRVIHS